MQGKRAAVLVALLLALVGALLFKVLTPPAPDVTQRLTPAPSKPLLDGANEIKSLSIAQGDDGYFYATVTYFYRGDLAKPEIQVMPDSPAETAARYIIDGQVQAMEPGEHTVRIELIRPRVPDTAFASQKIKVAMYNGLNSHIAAATKEVPFQNAWPDASTYDLNRYVAKMSVEQLHDEAVALINQGDDFATAKRYLELLLSKDPSYAAAYVELARYSMKTNWGPEGLKQAETYLKTGLSLQPNDAPIHSLLGYVYTYQRRYDEALAEFQTAEKSGSANLYWLWAFWGEYYAIQNQPDKAIAMYLKAVDGGRLYTIYDRARLDGYRNLFVLLNNPHGYAKADALYIKRAEEYPDSPCFRSDYAAFKIASNGDYQSAIAQSRKAIDSGCASREGRQVLGLANYLAWLKSAENEKTAYFVQAQLFFPESPELLYALAAYEATSPVLDELKKRGSSVDIKDNRNFNALAYALIENNVTAAQRLIKHGAKLNETVGEQNYPVAMAPIFYQHVEGVQLMLDAGVNLTSLKFQGVSASDYAKRSQNDDIIRLIKTKVGT